ncbi:glycosyltransferase family 2 protein [Paenibacillus cymbidii]|uniref:glycosyltransferase family 2 protein n=1 Tax=Paenibacillus cymbidii TaxID=1639034 RepID=UPI001080199F|nr:glycosyltransferase family 2 protein [Paenibacillus cymbidii]
MDQKKLLIAIPAYNEQHNIMKVIREIRESLPDAGIVVVNDCSRDATSDVARKAADVSVIDLPCNLGIGGAVQTGFKFACERGYEAMVQIDGDGQHIPREVDKLLDAMAQTGCDMVIGSRFLGVQSFRTTRMRRFGIRLFYHLFRILIRERVTDSTSGFRLYNRKCIELLSKHYPEDYPEPDAIILLKKNGLRISEVGVEMREREHGTSSISILKGPYYMSKVMVSIFFTYIRTRW